MTAPRDELRSPELLSSTRARVIAAAFVVLVVAVVAIVVLRPDRPGVGTPLAIASPSASASPSESSSPSPEPSPSPQPSPVPGPTPPALSAATGSRLVVVQGTKLEVLDVDSGQRTALPTDARLRDHDRLDVVSVGSELVFLGDDQTGAGNGPYPAYATTAGPGSRLRTIGEAGYVGASEHPGRVWLTDVRDDAVPSTTMTEVDLHGRVYRRIRLDGFGVDQFAGGFLRQVKAASETDDVELVDAAGKRKQHWPGTRVVLAREGMAVLSEDSHCRHCALRVLTAGSTITEKRVVFDSLPFLFDYGLTPDGKQLFVSNAVKEDGPQPGELVELDLSTGKQRPVVGAWSAPYYGPSMNFSPDGHWLFFVDATGRNVDVYDLKSRQAYRVPGTFGVITQLELLP